MKNIIQNKINNCKLCGTFPKLTKTSLQIGSKPILIIGESPTKNGWIKSEQAFYDCNGKLQASGKILEKLLNIIDLHIKDVYFTEMCKCVIEDRKNLKQFSQNCLPYLNEQISIINCKIILTLGLAPAQALLPFKIDKLSDIVGKQFNVNINNKQYILIPIYHPSPRNPKGYKGNIEIFEMLKNQLQQICSTNI